jgi:flagellar hook-associated protein FlgK
MKRHLLTFLSATAETQGNGSAKADQTDIVSQNAKLTEDLKAMTAERDAAKADASTANAKVSVITAERDAAKAETATANASLAAITTERDNLKTENTNLKGDKSTVESAAAKIVAAVGIVSDKAKTENNGATAKAKTLTEKVLEAQGVKTLAESETKYRERIAANPGL